MYSFEKRVRYRIEQLFLLLVPRFVLVVVKQFSEGFIYIIKKAFLQIVQSIHVFIDYKLLIIIITNSLIFKYYDGPLGGPSCSR